jgi:hypothetical protein
VRRVFEIAVATVLPDPADVLEMISAPPALAHSDGRTSALLREALAMLAEDAVPRALLETITTERFAVVFGGEGLNAPDAPLARIFPEARGLALFAATIGPKACARITELFDRRDFALGTILDAAASLAAEKTADVARGEYVGTGAQDPGDDHARRGGAVGAGPGRDRAIGDRVGNVALAYSPGYCGWHITAQRALFEALRPEEMGIRLNESCLMQPLKSISGVIAAGRPEIHVFDDAFPFCAACATRPCRERIRSVKRFSATRARPIAGETRPAATTARPPMTFDSETQKEEG